jgi:hypothetical protein
MQQLSFHSNVHKNHTYIITIKTEADVSSNLVPVLWESAHIGRA